MAKPNNLIPTVTLTISTTKKVEGYLEQLVYTGEFGKNTAEAAERVVVLGLQRLFESGLVRRSGGKNMATNDVDGTSN